MLMLNRKIVTISWLLSILFFASINSTIYSQNSKSVKLDNDEITSLTNKLSKKIILSETQNKQVSAILTEYSKQLDEIRNATANSVPDEISMKQLMTATAEKVIALLDEKQMMKFDIIKNDWWAELNSEAND